VVEMEKILKSKLLACILIFVFASSILVLRSDDVIFKEGDLILEGKITGPSPYNLPDAYIYYLSVDDDVDISGILHCCKIDGGYFDPEWVQYDRQTRLQVVESVKREVAPDKQGGAVLFFNKDTKKLETYIPDEGKFYDLQGNLIDTMPKIEVATNYKTLYYFDRIAGEIKEVQRTIYDKYSIKKGFRLDRETGHFINTASGEIVPKETAIELIKAL
jgi:hypothetical protein